MSRETDSPSSGPSGRGGAAYPSGTPPYGTPVVAGAGADAGRSPAPEERKTETTLTTRIRINIPGSRPIPPVVVRKPVGETESGAAAGEPEAPAKPARTAPAPAAAEAPTEPGPDAEEKTSDWFAPRKSGAGKPGQGATPANGTPAPAASAAPAAAPPLPPRRVAGGQRPAAGRPGGVVGSVSMPTGSRPGGTNGAGLPGATGGPVAPGHGGGTGSFDVTEALAAGAARPGAEEPRRDDLPYFSENAQNAQAPEHGHAPQNAQGARPGYGGPDAPGGPQGPAGPGGASGFNGPDGRGGPGDPQGPAGPTSGPVTGDGPVVPPVHGAPGAPRPVQAAPPGAPVPGAAYPGHGPGGGLSDDTAILTPQKPAPEPPGGFAGPVDNVSGHTVTSGIPVVPPAAQNFAGPATDAPLAHTPPKLPEPVRSAPAASPARPKKKGRNKLVLLAGCLIAVAGVAYGAGLLMNHSDVPKGTTVLGVDIGGGTRDEAVQKLEGAFGERVGNPLKLSVGTGTVALKPDQAGLQFDTQATVREAATSDYNPISVIGSLFGNERVVEPVMPVDEEKLHSALEAASGGSGAVTEGTISFASGKAVAVYGKPGQGIAVDQAGQAVEDAFRTQVETGAATPVKVPTTTRQPSISDAEVDRMMKEFAEPALSALVTIKVDDAHRIDFGPVSLPKILGVKAVDGKLVDTYDLEALQAAYGSTFEGVQIETATGKRDVLPQDVVNALRPALRGKTGAERTGIIETNPS
ncbi:hypothetical protein ABZZ79_04080 [Streptomyces sp. NPDC006458]|uniref:hypothetical protein n=1 Tax=Streptomyces sp. NPDC006458 TaxID=3154302 RepID=UPI0033BD7609